MTDLSDPDHSRHIPAGMTRDCIDPWTYIEFKNNGDVTPCCVRRPVGNLGEASLSQILNGKPIRAVRASLLAGQLDRPCTECGLRGIITTTGLTGRVRTLLQSVAPPADFDGAAYLAANPDVAAARADPTDHFLRHGRLEGRCLKPGR